ncbi:MAG TPA: hypothetical protein VFU93_03300 [Acidimicrobiales bacterium]|nr:hypothetical protein [Acidimicrobiales bacterium]
MAEVHGLAVEAALHAGADGDDVAALAVVGAAGGVRLGPAAELRHGEDRRPLGERRRQRGEEPVDAGVELGHPLRVLAGLVGVVVEVAVLDLYHAHPEVGVDQPGRERELVDQLAVLELGRVDRRHDAGQVDRGAAGLPERVGPRAVAGRSGAEVAQAVE